MKLRISVQMIVPLTKEIEIPDHEIRTWAEDRGEDESEYEGSDNQAKCNMAALLNGSDDYLSDFFLISLNAHEGAWIDADENVEVDEIIEPLRPMPKPMDFRAKLVEMHKNASNETQYSHDIRQGWDVRRETIQDIIDMLDGKR